MNKKEINLLKGGKKGGEKRIKREINLLKKDKFVKKG